MIKLVPRSFEKKIQQVQTLASLQVFLFPNTWTQCVKGMSEHTLQ